MHSQHDGDPGKTDMVVETLDVPCIEKPAESDVTQAKGAEGQDGFQSMIQIKRECHTSSLYRYFQKSVYDVVFLSLVFLQVYVGHSKTKHSHCWKQRIRASEYNSP